MPPLRKTAARRTHANVYFRIIDNVLQGFNIHLFAYKSRGSLASTLRAAALTISVILEKNRVKFEWFEALKLSTWIDAMEKCARSANMASEPTYSTISY